MIKCIIRKCASRNFNYIDVITIAISTWLISRQEWMMWMVVLLSGSIASVTIDAIDRQNGE